MKLNLWNTTGSIVVALSLLSAGRPAGQAVEESAEESVPVPPSRRPIAGRKGFTTTSEISFVGDSEAGAHFETSFIFPSRVRWSMSSADSKQKNKRIYYRFGERVFEIPPLNEGASLSMTGQDRVFILRQMELRRALVLFPEGFDWTERRAQLPELGHMEVELDDEGRPSRLTSYDAAGAASESLRTIRWHKLGERSWPLSLELWMADDHIWNERFVKFDDAPSFFDNYFLPPDRRETLARQAPSKFTTRRIPELAVFTVALKRGSRNFAGALLAWNEHSKRLRSEHPELSWNKRPAVELDQKGRPVALALRLKGRPPLELPRGFRRVPACQALTLFLPATGDLGEDLIRTARENVPGGMRIQGPYAEFDPVPPDGGRVRVVFPLSR